MDAIKIAHHILTSILKLISPPFIKLKLLKETWFPSLNAESEFPKLLFNTRA